MLAPAVRRSPLVRRVARTLVPPVFAALASYLLVSLLLRLLG
jgi:hypothetical protein